MAISLDTRIIAVFGSRELAIKCARSKLTTIRQLAETSDADLVSVHNLTAQDVTEIRKWFQATNSAR